MPTAVAAPTAPRSARHEAILDAVFELLGEIGYDQLSMDAVAARARASKATIYRAWQSKADLVMDAVSQRFGGPPELPDTGTLRGDLLALVDAACRIAASPEGAVLSGLMSAAARNPELSRALRRCTYEDKHCLPEQVIARAVARAEIRSGTDPDLLHEVLFAMVQYRLLWTAGPLDAAYSRHVVDNVLLPVLRKEPATPTVT